MKNLRQDIKANRKDPLILLSLVTYRFGNFTYYKVKLPVIKQIFNIFYRLLNLLVIRIIENAQIPAQCKIGPGLRLPHSANGIIIHPHAEIGSNVTIFHQVTIGENEFSHDRKPPVIGNYTFIGAGAKIIGAVTIGNHARIGTNAVVVKDVPHYATAVGIPAKVKIQLSKSING